MSCVMRRQEFHEVSHEKRRSMEMRKDTGFHETIYHEHLVRVSRHSDETKFYEIP